MAKNDYLIYYTIMHGVSRVEGNFSICRSCPINSSEEVESVREFLTEKVTGAAKQLVEAGGNIIIANIMPLRG